MADDRRHGERRNQDRRAGSFARLTFPKGAVILKEGDKGTAVYVILDGEVAIRKGKVSRNAQTLAIRTRGEVIGELALFGDKPHMASAVALKDTVVNAMSAEEFQHRLDELDPVMRAVMKLMAQRVRELADDLITSDTEVNWANWRRKL